MTELPDGGRRLRVLIADESPERLAMLAGIVRGIGHEMVAAEIDVVKVAPATARAFEREIDRA